MRILIVEDEKRLADTLRELLVYHKYLVDVRYDGKEGLYSAQSDAYDVIILDVMMPKMNGYEVLRELRSSKINTPVLMLTAKSETADKITGLDSGADYYLTKPFESEELLACLRALLRRQGEVVSDVISFGDISLNLSACTLECVNNSVKLSSKELELMRLLVVNQGNIISKETMLVKAWGYDTDAFDNHVEVYISFLRKKLQHIKAKTVIESVRMMGYRLSKND